VQRFVARSEKLAFQSDFFDEVELEVTLSELEEQLPESDRVRPNKKKRKRGFSDKLQRLQIHLSLTDEEKESISAQVKVLEYWQENAVFDAMAKTSSSPHSAPPTPWKNVLPALHYWLTSLPPNTLMDYQCIAWRGCSSGMVVISVAPTWRLDCPAPGRILALDQLDPGISAGVELPAGGWDAHTSVEGNWQNRPIG